MGLGAHGLKLIDVNEPLTGVPEFLWELLRQRMNMPHVNISHQKMPTMREHLEDVANHPHQAWYIIVGDDGEWVGTVYLTQRNEIGIHILPKWQRQGFARTAIKRIMELHQPLPAKPGKRVANFLANVNLENYASHELFLSMGAKPIQVTYALPPEEPDAVEAAKDKSPGPA